MSKAQLKKAVKNMDPAEIAEMLCELYDSRPEAKEYLEFWLNPDTKEQLEKYKVRIHRLFFTPSGNLRKRPTQSSIKKELKYFSTYCYESEFMAELYLYLCDTWILWLKEKRQPGSGANALRADFETSKEYIEKAALEDRFAIRLENLEEEVKEQEQRSEKIKTYGWRRMRWFK